MNMKRQIIFLLAIFFSMTMFAQGKKAGNGKERSPEQVAENRTEKWTKVLSLTPEQVPQVKAIILEKVQKMREVRKENANAADKKAMHQQMRTIKTDADAKMKGVLTQEQYDLYIKTKQENRKKAEKEKRKDIEEDDDL